MAAEQEQDRAVEVGTVFRLSPTATDWVYIYALCDPRNDAVRYIGQSINPMMRLRTHMTQDGGSAAKREWLTELRALGMTPYLRVIEVVEWRNADRAERRAIGDHHAAGCDLTNWPFPWKAKDGQIMNLACKAQSGLYNAVVDVAWEEGWGMSEALCHLLETALAARAPDAATPEERAP